MRSAGGTHAYAHSTGCDAHAASGYACGQPGASYTYPSRRHADAPAGHTYAGGSYSDSYAAGSNTNAGCCDADRRACCRCTEDTAHA